MNLIALNKLHPDPRNANVCTPEVMKKLKTHIQRNNLCPNLLVRPHPQIEGEYMLLDGHHRKQVIEELGWPEVECQVITLSEEDAGLLLLTLNRLRGVDNPRKRAELMQSMLPTWSEAELALLLPETSGEIEGLLALLQQDDDALEKAFKAQLNVEKDSLPVPFGFMVSAEDAPIIQEALAKYQVTTQADQGQAWVAICRDVLSHG